MRADRLIHIMVLLQNNIKMTTKELANELEVSERTILRDMDALSSSGFPIVSERGTTGGWRLMDHFRSQLSGVKIEDMKALFILPSEKMLEQLGVQTFSGDIRQKLLATLPDSAKLEAKHYLEKIYIDTDTWKPSNESNNVLITAQQALWENKKLSIKYQKANGECSSRIIYPLGLVAKGSVWYVVAMNEQDEYRSFKLSRISEAELLYEEFTRPEHFSLSQYWKESKLQFTEALPLFKVEVLAHPTILARLTFTDKFVKKVAVNEQSDDHMVPVTLSFNTEQEAISYVLGFGGAMKIVQPAYLIEKVMEQVKAIVQLYEEGQL